MEEVKSVSSTSNNLSIVTSQEQLPSLGTSNDGTNDSNNGAQSITASTLFEIINTIVTAANVDQGTSSQNQQPEGNNQGTSSQTTTPIQVQLHLNTDPSPPDNDGLLNKPNKGKGKKVGGETVQEKPIQPWHYHLGGVRQRRVPLSPEIKEALEVAYISRIMSKNFRKEGQPEKERISRITGLEIEKVHEWFKNRRKKDKLLQARIKSGSFTSSRRGRKKIIPNVLHAIPTSDN